LSGSICVAEEFTKSLVREQLVEGQVTYASGIPGNNHLKLALNELSPTNQVILPPALSAFILHEVGKVTFVSPVPSGAIGYGVEVLKDMTKKDPANPPKIITLDKKGKRNFEINDSAAEAIEKLKTATNKVGLKPYGIVIDDATSDGGTSEAYADVLTKNGLWVEGIFSVLTRTKQSIDSSYKRFSLLSMYIPPQLDWSEYKSTGIITPLKP
jgi:orotate phosphoribosyltransferase